MHPLLSFLGASEPSPTLRTEGGEEEKQEIWHSAINSELGSDIIEAKSKLFGLWQGTLEADGKPKLIERKEKEKTLLAKAMRSKMKRNRSIVTVTGKFLCSGLPVVQANIFHPPPVLQLCPT
ncbi:hypothetical protein STEG23_016249, partial [Scotinomys teguina]